MAHDKTRREFLRGAALWGGALAAAGSAAAESKAKKSATPKTNPKSVGSKSRPALRLAFIGVGSRGSSILQSALKMNDARVVAIADTYSVWRDRAVGWCSQRYPKTAGYVDYRDLLSKEKLDAVVIATPDHLHAPVALAAIDKGLDVYCEKPMTLTWQEAITLRDRVRAKKAILQVGTQLRSMPMYQKAREVVQSGDLGKLLLVQVNRHGVEKPLSQEDIPPEATESTVDWSGFLGGTPAIPYDPIRYFRWRQFLEYSNGNFGDTMLHQMDICHFITGAGMPARITGAGGIYHFTDARTTPDTIGALLDYPEGFQFNFTSTAGNKHYGLVERYLFSDGTIEIRGMGEMTIYRNSHEETVRSEGILNEPHLQNFFDCIRSRNEPIASIDAGVQGAICARLALESTLSGKAMRWDQDAAQAVTI